MTIATAPQSSGLVAAHDAVRAELWRLAELAARTTEAADAALVEARIAAALSALGADHCGDDHRALTPLMTAAGDAARPLSRRVAVLAELHRLLDADPA